MVTGDQLRQMVMLIYGCFIFFHVVKLRKNCGTGFISIGNSDGVRRFFCGDAIGNQHRRINAINASAGH